MTDELLDATPYKPLPDAEADIVSEAIIIRIGGRVISEMCPIPEDIWTDEQKRDMLHTLSLTRDSINIMIGMVRARLPYFDLPIM